MYIKRSIESIVKNRAKNSKCLLLTGSRQVGKSTLLKELYKDARYYTFDDKILLAAEERDPALFIKNISLPAIVDEVQYAKSLFPYIKIECDKDNTYENFYLTGSQQMKLMEKAKESLSLKFYNEEIPQELVEEKCLKCVAQAICPTCYGANYAATGNMYHHDDNYCELTKIIIKARSYFKAMQWQKGQLHLSNEELVHLLNSIKIIQEEL